jgi:cyanate lyase
VNPKIAGTRHRRPGAYGWSAESSGTRVDRLPFPTAVPTDPLTYRLYEIVNVYGSTIKEVIYEEFADGIMSAIDFTMELSREPDPH